MPLSRRQFLLALLGSAAAALGAACSSGPAAAPPASPAPPTPASAAPTAAPTHHGAADLVATPTGQFAAILPNSDLAVGPNRVVIALLDERNRPIKEAQTHVRFFKVLGEGKAQLRAEGEAVWRGSGLGDRGLYVTRATFDEAGAWGAEVTASKDGVTRQARVGFEVAATPRTPAIGTPAIPSRQKTATDPAAREAICSARPPDDMHDLTIADALTRGRPIVLLFATPGYCTSQTCGPDLQTVQTLEERYRHQAIFIHVEIYEEFQTATKFEELKVAPAVLEWNLPSEPWVFLIDRQGLIADKFEGALTVEELEPALQRLLT